MTENLLKYFNNIFTGCNKLAKQTGHSRFYFLIDFTWSLLRYGCSVRHYFIGGFWKVRGVLRKDIFTLRRMKQVMAKCNDRNYIYLLKEKNKFNDFFDQFVHRDWIFCTNATEAEFRQFLQKHKEVIVKPADTYEGKGIHKVSTSSILQDFGKYFDQYKSGRFMVEEVSKNHTDISFGGKALNTIRVYSFLDGSGNPHILKAVLRCGTGYHIVDNFHSGGVGYEVDLNTGIIISTGRSWTRENIVVHPGTDFSIVGRHIPEWEKVKSQCLAAASLIPQCRYVAWDIAVTEHGIEFIEGNHDGDFDLLEFFGTTGYWKVIKNYM